MSRASVVDIAAARMPDDIGVVRNLFREYITGLGVDLSFQDVDAEAADLPGRYAAPAGHILIAWDHGGEAVGCCALRPLADAGVCEMKRLYVRSQARGQDLGRRLSVAMIDYARGAGYTRVVLDTLAPMQAGQALYASLGFRRIAPYNDNPLPGTLHLCLDLSTPDAAGWLC